MRRARESALLQRRAGELSREMLLPVLLLPHRLGDGRGLRAQLGLKTLPRLSEQLHAYE